MQPGEFSAAELFAVEYLEHLHRLLQLRRDSDGRDPRVGERPGALLQHPDEVVDADLGVGVLKEGGELAVEILGCEDVCEHSVELRGELVSAGLLEPVDHRLLHVHGMALHMYESLAQGPRVELLKDILVIQILEQFLRLRLRADSSNQILTNQRRTSPSTKPNKTNKPGK